MQLQLELVGLLLHVDHNQPLVQQVELVPIQFFQLL